MDNIYIFMDYKQKYLKYKDKYLKLKSNQKGGVIPNTLINTVEDITDNTTDLELQNRVNQIVHIDDGIDNETCINEILQFVRQFLQELSRIAQRELESNTGTITFVSVGNTPYKALKLFQLLNTNRRINFVYIPYSGKFTRNQQLQDADVKVKIEMEAKAKMEAEANVVGAPDPVNPAAPVAQVMGPVYLTEEEYATGVVNLVNLINRQYTPQQLEHFGTILDRTGLLNALENSNKVIFIDYLESAKGFLSFLMTLDYYLDRNQIAYKNKIKVICVEPYSTDPEHQYHIWSTTWGNRHPQIIREDRLLNYYPMEYMRLTSLASGCGQNFFAAERFNDRCVKSYPKDRWVGEYENIYGELDLGNCNALLIYLYRRLVHEGFRLA
jgi:hypothetical protein